MEFITSVDNLIKQLRENKINFTFCKINDNTDIMIKEFRKIYDNNEFQINEINIELSSDMVPKVIDSIITNYNRYIKKG